MCDKDFANKANLKRHQEIHGDKRICPKCDATFSTTEGLRKHMKIQHEVCFLQNQASS